MVLDSSGLELDLQPLGQCRWSPSAPWEPGDYDLAGLRWLDDPEHIAWDEQFLSLTEPLLAEAWGLDSSLDTTALAGRVWELDLRSPKSCGALTNLLRDALDFYGFYGTELSLQIDRVEEDTAAFRLIWAGLPQDAAYEECTLLTAEASISDSGEFYWEEDERVLLSEPPMQAWDLLLRGGWIDEGETAGGVELQLVAQTAEVAAWVGDGDDYRLCEWTYDAGVPCGTCPDGSGDTCLTLELFEGTLQESDEPFAEDLPSCEVAFWEDSVPDPDDCGYSCAGGLHEGSGIMALGLVGLVGLRRRRQWLELPGATPGQSAHGRG